jgi:hypothetical protein
VWVAYYDASPQQHGHLVRVDPATTRIVDDVVVDTFPTWEVGGGGLLVAGGSVWITGSIDSSRCRNPGGRRYQAALVRVRAAGVRPVQTICLGGRFGADVAVDDAGVWVLTFGSGNRMDVVHLDRQTGTVLGRTSLWQHDGHQLLAVGRWIVADVTHNAGENTLLAVIDPRTGKLRTTARVDSQAWLASDGHQLWAATSDGLERLDPETGRVLVGPFDVGTTGDALAVSQQWVSALVPEGRRLFLMRLDPVSGTRTQVSVRGKFGWNAIALAPGALWGLGFDGILYRVDLSG